MNLWLVLAYLFFIGSLLGWCIEVVYRKFFAPSNPEHKWINPGFLQGPYLPLYGFGLSLLFLLAHLDVSFIPSPFWQKIFLFVLMSLAMTLIEYVAGLVFIKGMRVKLWDYSERFCNIQGIVCLQFSFYWCILGALYFFGIHPFVLDGLIWMAKNLTFSFVIGFFFGVFFIDFCYSLKIASKIVKFAKASKILVIYEQLQRSIQEKRTEDREKLRFFLSFRSNHSFREHLEEYQEKFGKSYVNKAKATKEKKKDDAKKAKK